MLKSKNLHYMIWWQKKLWKGKFPKEETFRNIYKCRKPTPSRHSRFGGTFSLKTSQGQVNVRTVDKFKNAGSHAVSISKAFDSGKKSKADGRNKPIDIFTEKLLVMGSSKKIFREVANGFLENCFTSKGKIVFMFSVDLFTSVKKDFDIDRKGLEETDYLHFFSVFSFFLEFHLATHEVLLIYKVSFILK